MQYVDYRISQAVNTYYQTKREASAKSKSWKWQRTLERILFPLWGVTASSILVMNTLGAVGDLPDIGNLTRLCNDLSGVCTVMTALFAILLLVDTFHPPLDKPFSNLSA